MIWIRFLFSQETGKNYIENVKNKEIYSKINIRSGAKQKIS